LRSQIHSTLGDRGSAEPVVTGRVALGVPWYNDTVVYGIDVGKFADGDGDGIGDFRGLAVRLSEIHLHNVGRNQRAFIAAFGRDVLPCLAG
jgi:hypothetical protein